jgi:hypothetical protein
VSGNKKIPWHTISKIVGWDSISVEYPTIEEITQLCDETANGNQDAMVILLRYFRFLDVAKNDQQREIISRIIDGIFGFRNKYCE